jgi:hypothetical protein
MTFDKYDELCYRNEDEKDTCPQCEEPLLETELNNGDEPMGRRWHARCWAEFQVEYNEYLDDMESDR